MIPFGQLHPFAFYAEVTVEDVGDYILKLREKLGPGADYILANPLLFLEVDKDKKRRKEEDKKEETNREENEKAKDIAFKIDCRVSEKVEKDYFNEDGTEKHPLILQVIDLTGCRELPSAKASWLSLQSPVRTMKSNLFGQVF